MSVLHRAFLYVTRKFMKSVLLFLILLVVATLTLSGIAIRGSAETAQLNVRQALGGIFTLQQNTSDPDKWVTNQVGGFGSSSYYGGAQLTAELGDYIQKNVSGIRGYNASYTNYAVPVNRDGEILELLEEEGESGAYNSLLAGFGDFNSTVATYASTNTAFDSYFTGGYLELVEGTHFTNAANASALISNELAEKNNLKVGDTITLRMSEYKASLLGYDAKNTKVDVKIAGLFKSTAKSVASLSNWSMDNSVFTTLDVLRTVRPDMGEEGYEKMQFYVDDPGELSNIVNTVKNLPNIDPGDFVINVDSSDVDAVLEPLKNVESLISILIILALVVGASVLYFVLAGRIKERVHESGVLLSLGIHKRSIISQYILEVFMIAVIAFSVSVMTSGIIAQSIGSRLMDYSMPDVSQGSNTGAALNKDGMSIVSSDDFAPQFESQTELTRIDVEVKPEAVVIMVVAGLLITLTAITIAAIPVLQMKPREILTKMS